MLACQGNKTAPAEGMAADTVDSLADTLALSEEERLLEEEPLSKAADELFDDFIFNFAGNRKLQLSRISFPLQVNRHGKSQTLQRDEWKTDNFFMRQGYYTIIFNSPKDRELANNTELQTATVERIYLNTHYVQQYVFNRVNGLWMLQKLNQQTVAKNPNASFLEFYQKFVSDSVFQRQSLASEMVFVGPDPDDDFNQMEGTITPEFWDGFAPEFPTRVLYNIIYGEPYKPSNQRIFIIRGIANGFEMELTFRKLGGDWKLVKIIT